MPITIKSPIIAQHREANGQQNNSNNCSGSKTREHQKKANHQNPVNDPKLCAEVSLKMGIFVLTLMDQQTAIESKNCSTDIVVFILGQTIKSFPTNLENTRLMLVVCTPGKIMFLWYFLKNLANLCLTLNWKCFEVRLKKTVQQISVC